MIDSLPCTSTGIAAWRSHKALTRTPGKGRFRLGWCQKVAGGARFADSAYKRQEQQLVGTCQHVGHALARMIDDGCPCRREDLALYMTGRQHFALGCATTAHGQLLRTLSSSATTKRHAQAQAGPGTVANARSGPPRLIANSPYEAPNANGRGLKFDLKARPGVRHKMSPKTLGPYPLPAQCHEHNFTRHHTRPSLGESRRARQDR